MARATRPVSLALVLVCVLGTMVLGAALKAPCANGDWGDGHQYSDLCYSDIVPLLGTEQLTGSRQPYLDACASVPGQNCDEYPVLTMEFMRAAAYLSGPHYASFYLVNMALLTVCAVAIAVCLYLMVGGRALYFALAPTLLIYGTMNWDLLAVAFATAAMLLFFARRDGPAGAALGLGAAAKFYPALLALPLIAHRMRGREPDRAIGIGWATAGTWLLVNVPFFLAAPGEWFRFFSFNSHRQPDFDSLWYIGCRHVDAVCVSTRTVNILSAGLLLVLFASVWWAKARRFSSFPRWTLGFPLIVLFLLTNKVYSPQYGLWLLPWFALALPGVRRFAIFQVADVAVFMTRFWWFGRLGGGWGVPQAWFEAMVLVRAGVLIWCLVGWVRQEHAPLPIERAIRARGTESEGSSGAPDGGLDPEALPA